MSADDFEEQCFSIAPIILKMDTNKHQAISAPNSIEDWIKINDGFMQKWNFPWYVGTVDGKHVMIQALLNSRSEIYS